MPATFLQKPIAILFVLLLGACATQPTGMHRFAIAADGANKGRWSLTSLSEHGRIDLTAYLQAHDGRAAKIILNFGNNDSTYSDAALMLGDGDCDGAYWIALSHRVSARGAAMDHLKTRVPWEQPLLLQVEWWKDGRFTVTVDGRETKDVQLLRPVADIVIDAYHGGIRVENLTYTRLGGD